MTESFEDCDWLVDQEGNKRALLRVGFIISLHFEITGIIVSFFTILFLSLSHTHTHTHTHYMCIYIFLIFIYHADILNVFYKKWIATQYSSESAVRYRPKSSLLHSFIFPVAKCVNVVITSISGAMAFQRGVWYWCPVSGVSMSLIRSVTNIIPARSNM